MTTATANVIEIDIDQVQPNPWEPRETIDPEALRKLADSIRREGLKQFPGVRPVRPGLYERRWGQRRMAAWRLLRDEDESWPQTMPMVVEDVEDKQMILDALTENLEREEVDLIEETRAMARAIEEIEELTQNDLAELLQTSPGQVSNRLRLLRLPDSVLQLVTEGKLAWTSARELLCLVGDDHTHDDEIDAVLKGLPRYKDSWTGQDVRDTVAEVCVKKSARWRPLEDVGESRFSWYTYYAAGKNAPIFDVEAFRTEHPKSVHKLPKRGDSGNYLWTCAGKEWKAAQAQAKEEQKIEEPPDSRRETWADAMAKDQVAQKLGLEREKFSTENTLTEDELEALGTRAMFVKSQGPSRQIAGTGHRSPPEFFNKNQCFSSCTEGAVYAEDYYNSSKYVLKCGNATCYQTKWQEGLDKFKVKESKRAEQTDAVRRKLADQVRPILESKPDVTRALLFILTQKVVDGRPTRPLGYSQGGNETAYHSPAAIRLATALGLPEDDVNEMAVREAPLWFERHAREVIPTLDDPVPAATEALSIALQEAGFTPGD